MRATMRAAAGAVAAISWLVVLESVSPAASSSESTRPSVVSIVGGSITRQPATAASAAEPGGHFAAPYQADMGGGTVVVWSNPSSGKWSSYDQWVAAKRAAGVSLPVVWWQATINGSEFKGHTASQLHALAEQTWAHLASRSAGQTVFVSPMFHYPTGGGCGTKDEVVDLTEAIVSTLIANHPELRAGPVFPPASAGELDGCHTNDEGDAVQGQILNTFFNNALDGGGDDNSATATVVTSSQNPAPAGAPVTFAATVTPASATGQVTFSQEAPEGARQTLGTAPLVEGRAELTTSALGVGVTTVVASLSSEDGWAPSEGSISQQIDGDQTIVSLKKGSNQVAVVGQPFSVPLSVTVTDGSGKPLTGVTVTFAAPDTGPSGTFARMPTAVTNSKGAAQVRFSANNIAGSYSVTASTPGAGNSVDFTLTNAPG